MTLQGAPVRGTAQVSRPARIVTLMQVKPPHPYANARRAGCAHPSPGGFTPSRDRRGDRTAQAAAMRLACGTREACATIERDAQA